MASNALLASRGWKAFFYDVGDIRYACSPIDFWTKTCSTDPVPQGAIARETSVGESNDTCWVSPSDPTHAVLRADAYAHLGDGTNRYITAALLLTATAALTIFGGRKKNVPVNTHAS